MRRFLPNAMEPSGVDPLRQLGKVIKAVADGDQPSVTGEVAHGLNDFQDHSGSPVVWWREGLNYLTKSMACGGFFGVGARIQTIERLLMRLG